MPLPLIVLIVILGFNVAIGLFLIAGAFFKRLD